MNGYGVEKNMIDDIENHNEIKENVTDNVTDNDMSETGNDLYAKQDILSNNIIKNNELEETGELNDNYTTECETEINKIENEKIKPEMAAETEKKNKKSGMFSDKKSMMIAMVMCAIMSIICCFISIFSISAYLNIIDTSYKSIAVPNSTIEDVEVVDPDGTKLTASQIYALAREQVVSIATSSENGDTGGSGFFIKSNGYIMTNYHVIEDAYKNDGDVFVTMCDGMCYTATIVEKDEINDIAVVKIMNKNFNAVTLGSVKNSHVGDEIYAVGNPLSGLNFTMTSGIISALDRIITVDDDKMAMQMFQIDAAVNSGNSGGPIYNIYGEVIGIVTAKYTTLGVEGLGFAIPIDKAVEIANSLVETGKGISRPYLGVSIDNKFNAMHNLYENMPNGALVVDVVDGYCAKEAGMLKGDVITKFDNNEIINYDDLYLSIAEHKAGDSINVVVYRDGEYVTLTVTLDEAENKTENETENKEEEMRNQSENN